MHAAEHFVGEYVRIMCGLEMDRCMGVLPAWRYGGMRLGLARSDVLQTTATRCGSPRHRPEFHAPCHAEIACSGKELQNGGNLDSIHNTFVGQIYVYPQVGRAARAYSV